MITPASIKEKLKNISWNQSSKRLTANQPFPSDGPHQPNPGTSLNCLEQKSIGLSQIYAKHLAEIREISLRNRTATLSSPSPT